MAFNNSDRKDGIKAAQSSGYSWNSDKSKLTNGSNSIRIDNGSFIHDNGRRDTSLHDLKTGLKK